MWEAIPETYITQRSCDLENLVMVPLDDQVTDMMGNLMNENVMAEQAAYLFGVVDSEVKDRVDIDGDGAEDNGESSDDEEDEEDPVGDVILVAGRPIVDASDEE